MSYEPAGPKIDGSLRDDHTTPLRTTTLFPLWGSRDRARRRRSPIRSRDRGAQAGQCRVLTGRDPRLQRSAPLRKPARDRDASRRARRLTRHPRDRSPPPSARRRDTKAGGKRQPRRPVDRARETPHRQLRKDIPTHLVHDRTRPHGERPCAPPRAGPSTRSRTRRTRATRSHSRGPTQSARLYRRHNPARHAAPAHRGVTSVTGSAVRIRVSHESPLDSLRRARRNRRLSRWAGASGG